MKYIALIIPIIVVNIQAMAQYKGSVHPNQSASIHQGEYGYTYVPPQRLSLPEKLSALIVYEQGEENYLIKKPLTLKKGKFLINFSSPDSVKAFILTIVDEKYKTIDNNNDSGFTVLCNKNLNEAANSRIDAIMLLSYFAPLNLHLDRRKLSKKILTLFEEAYTLSPELQSNHKAYRYYLSTLYEQQGQGAIPALLSYAKAMEKEKDEISLSNALFTYRLLRRDEDCRDLEIQIIQSYPFGELARKKYIDEFDKKDGKTELSILKDMQDYVNTFGDTSHQMKYSFFMPIISCLITDKKYDKLTKYEQQLEHKLNPALVYNHGARFLIDETIDFGNSNITDAKHLILRAMQIISSMKAGLHSPPEDMTLQKYSNKFLETYALALYRQGQFDSAYQFQKSVLKKVVDPELAPATALQLVIYAAKSKGDKFARNLAIEQLKTGNDSDELLEQLKELDHRLGIENNSDMNNYLSTGYRYKKMAAAIKKRFGSQDARNFTLTDLTGKTVSLSSFTNKIVVLDFWASWCGPCKASFPRMQEAVSKYKQDSSVVFLFIDSYENKSLDKMKTEAAKFLQDNKYDFQVLLDDKNIASNAYKVDYIPETFVISKEGRIVFMSNNNTNIITEIENTKKLIP